MAELHCMAALPRAGLGNLLFPWARCAVFARHARATMLTTSWSQVKLGPLLRRERDLRLYLDLFQAAEGEVRGLGRFAARLLLAELPEPHALGARPEKADGLVVFRGEGDHFARLAPYAQELGAALRGITRAKWLQQVAVATPPTVAIHVRRGDFVTAARPEDLHALGAIRTPLSWFIDMLRAVRAAGGPLPATVFSDGTDGELAALLAEPDVRRADTGSAIGDLLLMASAKVLIGSGGSSFGAWASFLGTMPTITIPGQPMSWFKLESAERFIGVGDPGSAPAAFLDEVARLGDGRAA